MSLSVWVGLAALGLVGAAAVTILVGLTYEAWAEARDARRYPPPGRLVDIGARKLHARWEGAGDGPVVVLVSGGGTPSVAEYAVQERIARFARVCAYDRPGLGWSPRSAKPLALEDHVADLHALLVGSGEPGPYVLVPESFGGLIAVSYALRHPQAVAGLVFVDAAETQSWYEQTGALIKAQPRWTLALAGILARIGVVRAAISLQSAALPTSHFSPEDRARLRAIYARPNPGLAEAYEVYGLTPADARRGPADGALGSRPIAVIRHGKPFTGPNAIYEPGWLEGQGRLARLSSDSRTIVAQNSGHEINLRDPDLVAETVKAVVTKVRSNRPSAAS